MSGPKVQEHLCVIEEVEIEMMTIGALIRTVHEEGLNRLVRMT